MAMTKEGVERLTSYFILLQQLKNKPRIVSETQIPWKKIAIEMMPFFLTDK